MTPRRVSVLARNLPFGCQTWTAVGTDAAWSAETHMLAHVVDLLAGGNWQRAGGKGQPPKPIDRPEAVREAQAKRDRAYDRAARFKARQSKKTTPKRPRDARGRFVSKEG